MTKLLLLGCLIGLLLFLFSRKLWSLKSALSPAKVRVRQGFHLVESRQEYIQELSKKTLKVVLIGVALLIITLLLALKIKIILLVLPLSLYLIGQLFMLSNHVKYAGQQQLWFNPDTQDYIMEHIHHPALSGNLHQDLREVREVKSVQANKGILFGYYELILENNTRLTIPFLTLQGGNTAHPFFVFIQQQQRIRVETKLFPIIA